MSNFHANFPFVIARRIVEPLTPARFAASVMASFIVRRLPVSSSFDGPAETREHRVAATDVRAAVLLVSLSFSIGLLAD
jgi:hypothetical protein